MFYTGLPNSLLEVIREDVSARSKGPRRLDRLAVLKGSEVARAFLRPGMWPWLTPLGAIR